jgi:glycosyltransferase involved in cell wall biosynthesis
MYKDYKISVVVPAFNEETQITRVIETMPSFIDVIVIVNDFSKDRTSEVVKAHPLYVNGKVVLLEHVINQGVGGAIATGYKWTLENGFDVAVVMAGDGQMSPADVPFILDPVIEDIADYTKGNRLVARGAFSKIPKIRFFGNSILSLLTKIASGYWHVADSQTGFTAINKNALSAIEWDLMYKRYGQPNDLLVRLNVENLRVIDVPIEPVYNVGEKSGIKVRKVVFTISFLLIRLFFWRLKEKYIVRSFHPLVFFYLFGFFNLFLSLGVFVRFIILLIQTGLVPEITLMGCLFTFSIGFNALGFAMWFDYEENKDLNPSMRRRQFINTLVSGK